jgi:polyhydroxyalkanoate synthesis repressor PhaR
MRTLKKYPNRRLYDTQASRYVTLDDVRAMVLEHEAIEVLDSRTGRDLTRSVLLQIIAAQEEEGRAPLLTNRLLTQLIRFYGSSLQGLLGRYIEQSVLLFLEQQERYQRGVRTVIKASPVRFLRSLADQNVTFWRGVESRTGGTGAPDDATPTAEEAPLPPSLSDAAFEAFLLEDEELDDDAPEPGTPPPTGRDAEPPKA